MYYKEMSISFPSAGMTTVYQLACAGNSQLTGVAASPLVKFDLIWEITQRMKRCAEIHGPVSARWQRRLRLSSYFAIIDLYRLKHPVSVV